MRRTGTVGREIGRRLRKSLLEYMRGVVPVTPKFVVSSELMTHAPGDALPQEAVAWATQTAGRIAWPSNPAALFQSDTALKKLVKTLKPSRCRIVEPSSAEHKQEAATAIAPRTLDPLDSFSNAALVASALEGWGVVSGYAILASSSGEYIALRHDWLSLPSAQWLDLTPLVASNSAVPRLLVEAKELPPRDPTSMSFSRSLARCLGHAIEEDEAVVDVSEASAKPMPSSTTTSPEQQLMIKCAELAELPATALHDMIRTGQGLPPELSAVKGSGMGVGELRDKLRAIGSRAWEDAFAGVNAEGPDGHVRQGPILKSKASGGGEKEGTLTDALRSCYDRACELEKQQQQSLKQATQALQKVYKGASVAYMSTVDGRLLVALDNAVPDHLVSSAREALQGLRSP